MRYYNVERVQTLNDTKSYRYKKSKCLESLPSVKCLIIIYSTLKLL